LSGLSFQALSKDTKEIKETKGLGIDEESQNSLHSLQQLAKSLTSKKDMFGKIPFSKRGAIAKLANVYQPLKKDLVSDYQAEGVTNAWLKLYEILYSSQLLSGMKQVDAFFNAELPGSFITCLNHYVHTICRGKLDWLACSLNRGVHLEDQFGLYKAHRGRWLQNEHMDGDVTNPENIQIIKNKVFQHYHNGVYIYLSDGGTNTDKDPNHQEELTSLLHLSSLLLGMSIIKLGGCMIVKQFTFFHKFTLSLMGILVDHFEEVEIVKPETSKRSNSESYLVCQKYLGFDSPKVTATTQFLTQLLTRCTETKLFPTQLKNPWIWKLHPSFLKQIVEISRALCKLQHEALDFFLEFAGREIDLEDRDIISYLSYAIRQNFTQRYLFYPLPQQFSLLGVNPQTPLLQKKT
jgi:hypothetical protein